MSETRCVPALGQGGAMMRGWSRIPGWAGGGGEASGPHRAGLVSGSGQRAAAAQPVGSECNNVA